MELRKARSQPLGGAWLKRAFQTVFRSAPFPVEPGLIEIGRPGRSSPVLVTSNFDLTVRRVCRALEGLDCYLLVAPAGGLDVWCAAGGGRFTVDSILSILKTTGIAARVDHRRLILPQLCANGVNLFEVRRRTGWIAVFGPADARDVPTFLQNRSRPESFSRVEFPLRERLQMAIAMWGSLSLRYTLFPVLLFGFPTGGMFVAAVAALSILVSVGCFVLPGKTFVQKAGVAWLPVGLCIGWVGLQAGSLVPSFLVEHWGTSLFAAYLVGTSFPSYSPLWQCAYSKFLFGFPDLELSIVEDRCIGCRLCDQVCPVDCFSPTGDRKVVFAQPDLCEGCMACLVQCPTDAIVNEVALEHQRLSACR